MRLIKTLLIQFSYAFKVKKKKNPINIFDYLSDKEHFIYVLIIKDNGS